MRKSNTQKLSEILREYIKESNIESKLDEVEVKRLWEELLGPSIGKLTKKVYVKKGVLHVIVSSSVLKHELLINRTSIMEKINKEIGKTFIKEIVFH